MDALRGGFTYPVQRQVSVDDEVALKKGIDRSAPDGPRCGTAYIGGVGLGFTTWFEAGSAVGCIAASGTGPGRGLQPMPGRGYSHG